MAPLAQNGSQFGSAANPNAILNDCREIDNGITEIERTLSQLRNLQQRSLDDPDSSANSATNRQLEAMASETMAMYRNFAGRIKAIKQKPESGSPKNAPQVGKVDRRLKNAIQEYQRVDADFRKKLQEQMARQYRIVRPDASEAEVREAVEDTSNQQVFSQALLQSDRRGQSRAALSAVQDRHAAIQKIESQMIELAELFQDMDNLVMQQDAAVANIEMKGEEVVDHMDKGTEQIGVAIKSARNARKWKWWCLGISRTSFSLPIFRFSSYLPHQNPTIYKRPLTSANSTHHSRHRDRRRNLSLRYQPILHQNNDHHKALRSHRLPPRISALRPHPQSVLHSAHQREAGRTRSGMDTGKRSRRSGWAKGTEIPGLVGKGQARKGVCKK